ncbi:MAG: CoA transferase [Ilumatobacteraceae bacterium]
MLHGRRPSLVITRVTGFGQDGPTVASGFATIAESMSGLAAISGFDGGQPLLPAIALTDEVTGLVSAFATLAAVHSGVGQVVDTSLLESMFQVMGPLPSYFGVAGGIQERLGAGLPYSVPRHVSVLRRPLDRAVGIGRFGGRAGARGPRRRRRSSLHDLRRPHGTPRRARGDHD